MFAIYLWDAVLACFEAPLARPCLIAAGALLFYVLRIRWSANDRPTGSVSWPKRIGLAILATGVAVGLLIAWAELRSRFTTPTVPRSNPTDGWLLGVAIGLIGSFVLWRRARGATVAAWALATFCCMATFEVVAGVMEVSGSAFGTPAPSGALAIVLAAIALVGGGAVIRHAPSGPPATDAAVTTGPNWRLLRGWSWAVMALCVATAAFSTWSLGHVLSERSLASVRLADPLWSSAGAAIAMVATTIAMSIAGGLEGPASRAGDVWHVAGRGRMRPSVPLLVYTLLCIAALVAGVDRIA
jgi:hypothetical protein